MKDDWELRYKSWKQAQEARKLKSELTSQIRNIEKRTSQIGSKASSFVETFSNPSPHHPVHIHHQNNYSSSTEPLLLKKEYIAVYTIIIIALILCSIFIKSYRLPLIIVTGVILVFLILFITFKL